MLKRPIEGTTGPAQTAMLTFTQQQMENISQLVRTRTGELTTERFCPDGRSATERFWMRKGTFGWGSVCLVLFLLAREDAVTGTPRTGM